MDTNFGSLIARQREYFESGATRSLSFRMEALRKLQKALRDNENLINKAMKADLNKSHFEAYMTETGMVLDEIRFHLKHLPRWVRTKSVMTPMTQFHAKSFVVPEPYGVALIMSPWNYPLQLCLVPLVGAISGGNCAVVKPSAYAPATSGALAKILGDIFLPEYVAVVEGGREQNNALLEEVFDYIFFTGSVEVGRTVMAAAAKHLTPVTLELGGKSPVIVDETANLKLAAKRIAFGKVLNAGQTCVEPDYLLIHETVKEKFLEEYEKALREFFPGGDMSDMPVIISEKHFQRVTRLLKDEKAAIGGGFDESRRFIEPSVLTEIAPDSPIMQEEIFGPILPLMTYTSLDDCIKFIRSRPRPLALYLFTESRAVEKKILDTCSFGGGCINDTIIHLANPRMGFGGVGHSGMGSYHGKLSFDTFTHYRSMVRKSTWIDLPVRYHPYSEKKFKMLRSLLK
ncbi:MAG TPA: aldehyde dehydrogenase [Anaerovoracaceae bacterium]|nr:aldehyde dehydrogenase [Anaerovoracaceae bacterium]